MASNKTGNMAHIADLLAAPPPPTVGLNNYIARALSPNPSIESIPENAPAEEKVKEKYVWRMHQPSEGRKYQLFPAKDKLSISPGRNSPDPEQAFAIAMSQSGHTNDRPIGSSLRSKVKDMSLLRRRKPSVSDLGPMTTVHEVAMDSPTIPGRPPLHEKSHERSASAPGSNTSRGNGSGESKPAYKAGSIIQEGLEISSTVNRHEPSMALRRRSASLKVPMSPRRLAPLVIPCCTGAAPQRISAKDQHIQNYSPTEAPPAVPPKSARMSEDKFSPQNRPPFTPLSSSTYTPLSTSTTNLSIASTATPLSATDGRVSPFPTMSNRGPSPMGHLRGQSDSVGERSATSSVCHRREQSENSITDRGRPKKRPEGSPITPKRSLSKLNEQAEQKAFETLPEGLKGVDVPAKLDPLDIDTLRQQALGQAAKFEVLGVRDVEVLSKELRGLDERCEYLRKTHHSLRNGRRNLHERICTYLRSPRTAQFSHTSLLKQEEALIELDLSIDDWILKLDHAENRRMRVRQKLLEHVAAVFTIPSPVAETSAGKALVGQVVDGKDQIMMTTIALNRHVSMGEDTPPRSPTKEQARPTSTGDSPQRLALPIKAQTPTMETHADRREDLFRMSKESIRIYADSDIHALLTEVEAEIKRMSTVVEENSHEILKQVTFIPPVPSRTGSPANH